MDLSSQKHCNKKKIGYGIERNMIGLLQECNALLEINVEREKRCNRVESSMKRR